MPASLLSVNGRLRPLYFDATEEPDRAAGYSPVEIGKPLMVRYLRLFLRFKDKEEKKELMISTFLKAEESKKASAEAINFFDPSARPNEANQIALTDFGGENYGHPL